MTNEELNGKIEGLAHALAGLVANMEMRDIMDGPHYCKTLRQEADRIQSKPVDADPETARMHHMMLCNLADFLDASRKRRR